MSPFPFYFIWEDANNAGDKQLSRYSSARGKSARYYFFEFPRGMWHNYIRVKIDFNNSKEKKCFAIRWHNKAIDTKLDDYEAFEAYSSYPLSYNWHIDQFTDTVYSTLPKHVIEREFPEFRGVYKYLAIKAIRMKTQVKHTKPDSLPDQIEFEYNK